MAAAPAHSLTHGRLLQNLPALVCGVHHTVPSHHSSSGDACPGHNVPAQPNLAPISVLPATKQTDHTFSNALILLIATKEFPFR